MRGAFVVRSVCVLGLAAVGCATGSGPGAGVVAEGQSVEAIQSALHGQVEDELARQRRSQGESSARLLFSKPYYYKEFWEYPAQESVFSVDFTRKESLSIPMTAEVEVEKVRFATRVRRDRGEVRDDGNYLRSIGIEQASYELRHGEWRRVGSLFLASTLEEQRDGEWVQIEEERQPLIAIEEEAPGGFWRRLMFWR